jgi:hypothetical protein
LPEIGQFQVIATLAGIDDNQVGRDALREPCVDVLVLDLVDA